MVFWFLAFVLQMLELQSATSTPLTPIPVVPWAAERVEEKYTEDKDCRTPILPPIPEGAPPPPCENPPDEATVLRAIRPLRRGVPYIYQESREDVQVVTERLVDKIDPPRFFPLVGLAQLHHCHWKCTVYCTEICESDYPFPFRVRRPAIEVIYIDKDHLHLCAAPEETVKAAREERCPTVGVRLFKNRTPHRGLELELTRAVIREIELTTPFKVVGEDQDPDTMLTGTVSLIDADSTATEASVAVKVVWKDLRSGAVLAASKNKLKARIAIKPETGEPDVATVKAKVARLAEEIRSVMERPW